MPTPPSVLIQMAVRASRDRTDLERLVAQVSAGVLADRLGIASRRHGPLDTSIAAYQRRC